MTRQPARRSVRVTSASRFMFRENFCRQNARLLLGCVACLGQACQKQPSTKTARRTSLNTKSGLTLNFRFLLSEFPNAAASP